MTPLLLLLALVVLPPLVAATGYQKYPGVGHFKWHHTPKTWYDAESTCEKEDATLPVIKSEEQLLILQAMSERYADPNVVLHAGFSDPFNDGKFVTIFGEPLRGSGWSPPWQGGTPQRSKEGFNCGGFGGFSTEGGGGYSVGACDRRTAYICERNLHYRRTLLYPFKKMVQKVAAFLFD